MDQTQPITEDQPPAPIAPIALPVPEGRAAVRQLLIARLDEAGLQRPRRTTQAVLERTQKRLVERLAYMSAENLETLAEELLIGARDHQWPSETVVWLAAQAIQRIPVGQRRIVHSWLASKEGPMAEAGGYLVELYRFLRASQRPVLAGDLRTIREEAAENNRRVQRIRERMAHEMAGAEDRDWLERYLGDQREARNVVQAAADAQGREAGSDDQDAP